MSEERLEFRHAKRRLSTALICFKEFSLEKRGNRTLFVRDGAQDGYGEMCEQRSAFIKLQPAHDAMVLQIFSDARFVDAEMFGEFSFRFAPSRLPRPLRSKFPMPTRSVWQASM